MQKDPIEYFYSVRSVYAYLGAARIAALAARFGRKLLHKPVDLGKVVAGFGSPPIVERNTKHKTLYFGRELERWSEFLGMPLTVDPKHHFGDRLLPSGAILAAQAAGLDTDALSLAILRALWRDDRDIADREVLAELCKEAGIDAQRVLAAALSEPIQAQFAGCSSEAIAKDVPGSPAYVVDGEVFYGQNRLEMVERAPQGFGSRGSRALGIREPRLPRPRRPFAPTRISRLSW